MKRLGEGYNVRVFGEGLRLASLVLAIVLAGFVGSLAPTYVALTAQPTPTKVVVTDANGTALTFAADVAEDAAVTDAGFGPMVLSRRVDTPASTAGASGENAMFNTNARGALWTQPDTCGDPAAVTSVAISTAASGNTQLVALASSQIVYVCGYSFVSAGIVDVQLITGTGTACATGETDLTGAMSFVANTGISVPNTGSVQTKSIVSNALCIELSAGIQVSGLLTYVQR